MIKKIIILFIILYLAEIVHSSDILCKFCKMDNEVCKHEPYITKNESKTLNQVAILSKKGPNEALNFLKANINADSSSALYFAMGNLFYQLDKLELAENNYLKAIDKNNTFLKARENLARIYIQKESYKEALNELTIINENSKSYIPVLLLKGYTLIMLNKSIASENVYREIISNAPDNIDAYLGLSKSLLLQENYISAIRVLKEILLLDPLKNEIWSLLANCYMNVSKPKSAIITLECANELDCIQADSLSTLGDLYLSQNMTDEALKIFKSVVSLKKLNVDRLLRAIEGFLILGDYKKANDLYIKILKKNIKDPLIENKIKLVNAKILKYNGKYDESLKILNDLIKKDPLNGEILFLTGSLYFDKKDFINSEIYFKRSLKRPLYKRKSLIKLAEIEVQLKHLDKALDFLKKAQQIKFQKYIDNYVRSIKRLLK